jgi:hypothetical protein
MSQENVEKVRAALATWDGARLRAEARPFDRINSVNFSSGLYAPDAVYEDAVLPDHAGEAYRGLDGFIRAADTWMSRSSGCSSSWSRSSTPMSMSSRSTAAA